VAGVFSVIVCSCNILSDQDIRKLAADPEYVPPRVARVYERLGCKAECGRCARTIATIMRESITTAGEVSEENDSICVAGKLDLDTLI
jgi:bacterioferritin-associated ferredoxin